MGVLIRAEPNMPDEVKLICVNKSVIAIFGRIHLSLNTGIVLFMYLLCQVCRRLPMSVQV